MPGITWVSSSSQVNDSETWPSMLKHGRQNDTNTVAPHCIQILVLTIDDKLTEFIKNF